jgi:hypothetical protein
MSVLSQGVGEKVDDLFVSDAEALRVRLDELEADGIEAYIGLSPGERSH